MGKLGFCVNSRNKIKQENKQTNKKYTNNSALSRVGCKSPTGLLKQRRVESQSIVPPGSLTVKMEVRIPKTKVDSSC